MYAEYCKPSTNEKKQVFRVATATKLCKLAIQNQGEAKVGLNYEAAVTHHVQKKTAAC